MNLASSEKPLVSVIIPTYNRAPILPRALESVISQSYEPLEIIIVDDGSTDNTAAVIKAWQAKTTRSIKYVYQSNGGCSSARNHGIQLSTGRLIALLDSDDSWLPEAIERLVGRLLETGADMVFSPAIERYGVDKARVNIPVAAACPDNLAVEHFLSTNIRNGSVLFKRQIFEQLGYYRVDLKYNEDSDFMQRAALHFKAAYLEIPTVQVFHHDSNKSQNRPAIYEALLRSSEEILQAHPDFAQQLGPAGLKRINEIRCHLLRSLISNNQVGRAKRLAAQWSMGLPVDIQLALWWNRAWPVDWFTNGRRLLNALKHKFRTIWGYQTL